MSDDIPNWDNFVLEQYACKPPPVKLYWDKFFPKEENVGWQIKLYINI